MYDCICKTVCLIEMTVLEYNCQLIRVHVKRVEVWELYMYVSVRNDNIQGLTFILQDMYNEANTRKLVYKPSEEVVYKTSVYKIRN